MKGCELQSDLVSGGGGGVQCALLYMFGCRCCRCCVRRRRSAGTTTVRPDCLPCVCSSVCPDWWPPCPNTSRPTACPPNCCCCPLPPLSPTPPLAPTPPHTPRPTTATTTDPPEVVRNRTHYSKPSFSATRLYAIICSGPMVADNRGVTV